jgi:hypothetical protein
LLLPKDFRFFCLVYTVNIIVFFALLILSLRGSETMAPPGGPEA